MRCLGAIFIIIILSVISCIKEPEFEVPPIVTMGLDEKPTSDIRTVISRFNQSDVDVFTFDPEITTIVSAYVISSDEAGNFYKTMVVQDQPENPSRGIEIKLDLRSYYSKYNFGRKILLRLSGLSIQKKSDKYVLGYLSGNLVEDIPESLIDHFIIRSSETMNIIPKKIKLEDVSSTLINTFVELDGIQFAETELGKSFAAEVADKYNGERLFEQCDNDSKGLLYTSTYADFGSHLIPKDRFLFQAVLTSDSYTGDIVFVLNNTAHISIVDKERCDPSYFDCSSGFSDTKKQEIYYEDFEKLSNSKDIENIGWKNINANYGNGRFKKRSKDDNTFLQVSAYDSKEYIMEVWLISPLIDLDKSENEYLTFDTRATFEEGSILTCWFSTDYDKNLREANWQQLDVDISVGSRDASNDVFLNSGKIKLHCLEGKIQLAFRYLGSDPGTSTTYDIDNILILGDYLTD